jgi:hypothetical protein
MTRFDLQNDITKFDTLQTFTSVKYLALNDMQE